jgi:AMMECR1 domain-containing protein
MTLTNDDFKNIKELVKTTIDEDETLIRKDDIKNLPTKDEFYNKMDEVMGELKTIREEVTILSDLNRKVNDNEERIEKVENKLGIQPAI